MLLYQNGGYGSLAGWDVFIFSHCMRLSVPAAYSYQLQDSS